jgi:hypothetical protein
LEENIDLLEEISYALGFSDIDKGVDFIRNNFEILKKTLEGDSSALQEFQKEFLKTMGIIVSKVDSGEIEKKMSGLGLPDQ